MQRSILRSLCLCPRFFGRERTDADPGFAAKAYYTAAAFDPENLTRAEAALQELIASVDACEDVVSRSPFAETHWRRTLSADCPACSNRKSIRNCAGCGLLY